MQEIVPKKGLGLFTLEDSINKTLSIIKQNGNILEAYDMTTEAVVTKLMWILS